MYSKIRSLFGRCMVTLIVTTCFCTLFIPYFVFAQGDSPDCSQTVSGTDATCSNQNNDCSSVHSCERFDFTASCTGNYTLDAWVTCNTTDCSHCAACVLITKTDFVQVGTTCSTLSICSNSTVPCKKTCSSVVPLVAGTNYILWVCLTYCPDEDDCTNCSDCTAHGCARYAVTATCY